MLVGHLIFFEQLCHFFGHHITIILNGNQGNFFSSRKFLFRGGEVGWFRILTHKGSVYTSAENAD